MREVDLVVVGTGSAGTSAAAEVRKHGWSVAVVDSRPYGGTCALRGCDPKKVLVHAARVIEDARQLRALGVLDAAPAIRWPELMRFKRSFTNPVSAEREREFASQGIEMLHGRARFEDPQTLAVDAERIRFNYAMIAAGAVPRRVAPGDEALLSSEQFLDMEELPQSLLFAGGGYIAFEFAHVAARAGSEVTILHRGDRVLEGFDGDVVDRLVQATREIGIRLELRCEVTGVERDGSGVVIHAKQDGAERAFRAAAGVLAAGRVPDIEDLALEAAGVEQSHKGVKVDAHLRSTGNPRIFAAGDAADGGGLPLTPVASYEGTVAARNMLQKDSAVLDFTGLVTMVYAIPALGSVGLTEAQAKARGLEFDVHSGDMTSWYSSRHVAARAAYYKTVVEKGSGNLLGATIFGPHAEEQLNVLALALRAGTGTSQIEQTLFGYPTGSSDFSYILG